MGTKNDNVYEEVKKKTEWKWGCNGRDKGCKGEEVEEKDGGKNKGKVVEDKKREQVMDETRKKKVENEEEIQEYQEKVQEENWKEQRKRWVENHNIQGSRLILDVLYLKFQVEEDFRRNDYSVYHIY